MHEIIKEYIKKFPEDAVKLQILSQQIKSSEDLISRKNMNGHLTGSGFVIHDGKILLIFHKAAQKYFQPGGHCDRSDTSLAAAAEREVREETGLRIRLHEWHAQNNNMPIHVDSHHIEPRPDKGEGEHYHHDAGFVFMLEDGASSEIVLQEAEVGDSKWLPFDSADIVEPRVIAAIKRMKKEGVV